MVKEIKDKKWQRILTNYEETTDVLQDNRKLLPYEITVYKEVK